jgi:tRNA(Ile)-lysidine synthase TilS/MesJ
MKVRCYNQYNEVQRYQYVDAKIESSFFSIYRLSDGKFIDRLNNDEFTQHFEFVYCPNDEDVIPIIHDLTQRLDGELKKYLQYKAVIKYFEKPETTMDETLTKAFIDTMTNLWHNGIMPIVIGNLAKHEQTVKHLRKMLRNIQDRKMTKNNE